MRSILASRRGESPATPGARHLLKMFSKNCSERFTTSSVALASTLWRLALQIERCLLRLRHKPRRPMGAQDSVRRCRDLLPSPLWGGEGGGGRAMRHCSAILHDPPPHPSPTRGYGIHRSLRVLSMSYVNSYSTRERSDSPVLSFDLPRGFVLLSVRVIPSPSFRLTSTLANQNGESRSSPQGGGEEFAMPANRILSAYGAAGFVTQ
jgi:hypothetical protein